jgi:hypothetical protein
MAFFHPNAKNVPVEATFHPNPHSDSYITQKELYRCFPENKQDKGPGDIIRFHVSTPNRLVDTRSIAFFFNLNMTNQNESRGEASFHYTADTLIKSLQVSFNNSHTVEFLEEYHRMFNIFKPYISEIDESTHRSALLGGVWNTLGTTKQICLKFEMSGVLGINKYLPMDFLGTLDLEIRLASSAEQNGDMFTISNPYLTMDTYHPSPDYFAALSSIVQQQGLVLEYPSFSHFSRILNSTRDEIILTRNVRSAKGIFVLVTKEEDNNKLRGPRIRNNRGTTNPGTDSYRISINGKFETHQPIGLKPGTDVEHYYETLKAFDLHGLDRELLHYPYSGEVIAYNLEKSSLMSGQNIREIRLEFLNQDPQPRQYHVFIYFDQQALIAAGRQFMTQY